MNKLAEIDDFSMYDGNLPCVLCKGDSAKTILGNHWKCSKCDHIFNQDGSDVGVDCHCKVCGKKRSKQNAKANKLVVKALEKLQKAAEKISKKTEDKE